MGTGLFAVGCKALRSGPRSRQEALKPFRGLALGASWACFSEVIFYSVVSLCPRRSILL